MDNLMKANDGKGTKDDQGIITICKEHFGELRNTNTIVALKVGVVEQVEESSEGFEHKYRIEKEEVRIVIKLLKLEKLHNIMVLSNT